MGQGPGFKNSSSSAWLQKSTHGRNPHPPPKKKKRAQHSYFAPQCVSSGPPPTSERKDCCSETETRNIIPFVDVWATLRPMLWWRHSAVLEANRCQVPQQKRLHPFSIRPNGQLQWADEVSKTSHWEMDDRATYFERPQGARNEPRLPCVPETKSGHKTWRVLKE